MVGPPDPAFPDGRTPPEPPGNPPGIPPAFYLADLPVLLRFLAESRKINELRYELNHLFVLKIVYPQKAA